MNIALLQQLLQGAASTGAATIRAIPELIPTEYDKDNKKRLATLKQLFDSGQLGLTESEKARIYEAQSAGLEKQLQQAKAGQDQLAAMAAGTGAGNELRTATMLGSEAARSRAAINRDVEALNQKRRMEMEQEMWARDIAASEAKKQKLSALASIPAAGLEALAGAGAVNATVAPTATKADYTKQLNDRLMSVYGLSENEAALLAAQSVDNPALLSSLDKLLK